MSNASQLKVSVVVPTYRPGDGLDRLVASLDAQTLPTSDFEVIFVDDGSPDDTYARLQRIAASRPNVRVERIENSGWPCRPRNVGTDLATGEYVAYMDHDDLLFPDALRGAYEYGAAHGADVVNGKEARTHDASWAIDLYRADEPQSIGRTDQHPLIPMNPHKLYRRAFLQEHGIRFREGGVVMWEDIFFNMLVDRHATTISTLASVPYYHWYMTPGSGSKGFLRSGPEFWRWLREVLTATETDLAGDAHERSRRQLLAHQYRGRILGSFDGRFPGRAPEERAHIYGECRTLQRDFGLTALDDMLDRRGLLRARLLAADRADLLEQIATIDPAPPVRGEARGIRWNDGVLEITAEGTWQTAAGVRHALRRQGDRLVKALRADVLAVAGDEVADVTDEIAAATAEIGLRSRESRVTWMAPSESTLRVEGTDAAARVALDVRARIDPDTIVFGRALEAGLWDLNLRGTWGNAIGQPTLRSTLTSTAWIGGDRIRLAYPNNDGNLTLALDRPQDAVARLRPTGGVTASGQQRAVAVGGVVGEGSVDVTVQIARAGGGLGARLRGASPFRTVPATLVAGADGGRIVFVLPAGWSDVRVTIGSAGAGARAWWTVGDARAVPGPEAATPAAKAKKKASLPRRAVRALRRRVRGWRR